MSCGVAKGAGRFERDVVASEACPCVGGEDAFFCDFDDEVGLARGLGGGLLHLDVDGRKDVEVLEVVGGSVV